jgi:hypothetical protein
MSQETLLRARLEVELRAAYEELARLEAERLRLARKNEALASTMYALRSEYTLPELAQRRIEAALAFDGQPWAEEREPDDEEREEP